MLNFLGLTAGWIQMSSFTALLMFIVFPLRLRGPVGTDSLVLAEESYQLLDLMTCNLVQMLLRHVTIRMNYVLVITFHLAPSSGHDFIPHSLAGLLFSCPIV